MISALLLGLVAAQSFDPEWRKRPVLQGKAVLVADDKPVLRAALLDLLNQGKGQIGSPAPARIVLFDQTTNAPGPIMTDQLWAELSAKQQGMCTVNLMTRFGLGTSTPFR